MPREFDPTGRRSPACRPYKGVLTKPMIRPAPCGAIGDKAIEHRHSDAVRRARLFRARAPSLQSESCSSKTAQGRSSEYETVDRILGEHGGGGLGQQETTSNSVTPSLSVRLWPSIGPIIGSVHKVIPRYSAGLLTWPTGTGHFRRGGCLGSHRRSRPKLGAIDASV